MAERSRRKVQSDRPGRRRHDAARLGAVPATVSWAAAVRPRVRGLLVVLALGLAAARVAQERVDRAEDAAAVDEAHARAVAMDRRWRGMLSPPGTRGEGDPVAWQRCLLGGSGGADPACAQLRGLALRNPPVNSAAGWALVESLGPNTWLEAARDRPLPTLAWGRPPDAAMEPLQAAALGAAVGQSAPSWSDARAQVGCLPGHDAPCGWAPDGGVSASVGREVLRATASAAPRGSLGSGLGQVAAAVRRGEALDPAWVVRPGWGGALALELGALGRPADLPLALDVAARGGAPLDRLSGLYAAARIADPSAWPSGPERRAAEQLGLSGPRPNMGEQSR